MNPPDHPFVSRPGGARRLERIVFWIFRAAAYLILACGAAVFLDIVAKGSVTVFQARAPFINTAFFTQAPESLYVFEWEGSQRRMGDREFRAFKEANPAAADVKAESYVYSSGGIFPCIAGTVLLVVGSMTIALFLGVCAAIYLNEYARDGRFIRFVRLAILNLAGVPSIVFGVFGLGFFVYVLGGSIDQLFFADQLKYNNNTPVFGTGGLLWCSLTLALMTLPVVIVATEEALAAVPRGMREASLATGASKWQTIRDILLPASAPGILTGVILAMARGAGEVAPLMLVGVVKLAPSLPFDGSAPFLHMDRKFMHLGFHVYDLGFQSPDSDAARPMVFATTLLLIVLVVCLNIGAIWIRNRLRARFKGASF